MALLIVAILTLVSVGFVLLPFVRSRPGARAPRGPSARLALVARREALYREMEALRLERELGSVEEEEYERRLREYRTEAAGTLWDQERLEEQLSRLEEVVASARAELHADGASRCPTCGAPVDRGSARCPSCGAALETGGTPTDEGTDR